MARFITLSNVLTGNVLGISSPDNRWDWITRFVAHEFECDADDLDCEEDDDMNEFVTLRGERLVQIHDGVVRNPPMVQFFQQAAE